MKLLITIDTFYAKDQRPDARKLNNILAANHAEIHRAIQSGKTYHESRKNDYGIDYDLVVEVIEPESAKR